MTVRLNVIYYYILFCSILFYSILLIVKLSAIWILPTVQWVTSYTPLYDSCEVSFSFCSQSMWPLIIIDPHSGNVGTLNCPVASLQPHRPWTMNTPLHLPNTSSNKVSVVGGRQIWTLKLPIFTCAVWLSSNPRRLPADCSVTASQLYKNILRAWRCLQNTLVKWSHTVFAPCYSREKAYVFSPFWYSCPKQLLYVYNALLRGTVENTPHTAAAGLDLASNLQLECSSSVQESSQQMFGPRLT